MPFISICLRQETKPCYEPYVRTLGGVRHILRLRERPLKTSRDKNPDHHPSTSHASMDGNLFWTGQWGLSGRIETRHPGHHPLRDGSFAASFPDLGPSRWALWQ